MKETPKDIEQVGRLGNRGLGGGGERRDEEEGGLREEEESCRH